MAVGDWLAVEHGRKRDEYALKPATLVLLIAVASVIGSPDGSRRAWFVAALVLSLAGDVFLMLDKGPERALFVPGLASFLLAHIAYVIGWLAAGVSVGLVAALVAGVWVAASPLLWRIVKAIREHHKELVGPVVAYSVAIAAMVGAALAGGIAWGIAGALLFFGSDFMIAWSRFVSPFPHHRLAIIVTYHLGQAGLVLSLLQAAG